MAIIKIRNAAIDLDAAEIPNIDASKITTGSLGADRIPGLAASKITSGTFDDARIAASNVSQHATSFDDNKIVNDISTLALRQASDQNKSAYNTNSQSVDVFQDDTGIDTKTNTSRNANEYVSSITGAVEPTGTVFYLKGDQANGSTTFTDSSSSSQSITQEGGIAHSNTVGKIGSTSIYFDGTDDKLAENNLADFDFNTGEFRIETWINFPSFSSDTKAIFAQGGFGSVTDYSGYSFFVAGNNKLYFYSSANDTGAFGGTWSVGVQSESYSWSNNTWYHVCVSRGSDGTIRIFRDGTETSTYSNTDGRTGSTQLAQGSRGWHIGQLSDNASNNNEPMYIDNFLIGKGSGSGISSNFTAPTEHYGLVSNATGNFTGTTITAPSSVSEMGAIITYQDNAGTNALNTDIVLQLSADGGSNYSTATLTALPDFSTGIKMAKVNDLAVTAGTQLKYKINFANQASGSKEARIRGVALQY